VLSWKPPGIEQILFRADKSGMEPYWLDNEASLGDVLLDEASLEDFRGSERTGLRRAGWKPVRRS